MSDCNLHFELPRALILNANDRRHWAEKARITKNLRAMGAIAVTDGPWCGMCWGAESAVAS